MQAPNLHWALIAINEYGEKHLKNTLKSLTDNPHRQENISNGSLQATAIAPEGSQNGSGWRGPQRVS